LSFRITRSKSTIDNFSFDRDTARKFRVFDSNVLASKNYTGILLDALNPVLGGEPCQNLFSSQHHHGGSGSSGGGSGNDLLQLHFNAEELDDISKTAISFQKLKNWVKSGDSTAVGSVSSLKPVES